MFEEKETNFIRSWIRTNLNNYATKKELLENLHIAFMKYRNSRQNGGKIMVSYYPKKISVNQNEIIAQIYNMFQTCQLIKNETQIF